MHLAKSFEDQLAKLSDVDLKIMTSLTIEDINTEEIAEIVDNREQLLLSLLNMIEHCPEFAQHPQWHSTVQETQRVVELMQSKTDELAQALQKFRYGKKSLQQYKKFL